MAQNDRSTGAVSSVAVKSPVKCVTSAAITLSGEQTVNGTAVVTDDRVLVKDQADSEDNGIYVVDTGAWSRSKDFDATEDVLQGTMVFSVAQLKFYYVTSADNPTIDTDDITFSQAPVDTSGASAYFQTLFTAASASALRSLLEITRIAFATGAGTVDAITADFDPSITAWDQTMLMMVEATGANTSTTPTLTPDALTGKTIVKGANQALEAGDIPGASFLMLLRYDTSLDKVQLLNPAKGVVTTLSAVTPGVVQNCGLAVSLAANAMTIAVKDKDGNDPSASSPVDLYVQSATITTGTYAKRSLTAAESITIAATATGGTLSAVPSRLYVGLLDNAGTLELCWWNSLTLIAHPVDPTFSNVEGILRVNPGSVHSTTANTAGSDSARVIYSTTARTNVRIWPIAYIDSTQATAGNWATAITRLTLIGPKTPITGDLLQEITDVDGAVYTGTTVIPMDDTVPISGTDGDGYLGTLILTNQAAQNIVEAEAILNLASSVATDGLAVYIASTAGSAPTLAVQAGNVVAAGDQQDIYVKCRTAGVSAGNYGLAAGGSAAGTTTVNGRAGGRLYGGSMGSRFSVREICA